jgi:hypothetical protein
VALAEPARALRMLDVLSYAPQEEQEDDGG